MTRVRPWLLSSCLCVATMLAIHFLFDAAPARAAGTDPSTAPTIEQARIDAAMSKLRDRQQQRAVETANPATAPSTQPGAVAHRHQPDASDPATYPRDMVIVRKLQLLNVYEQQVAQARAALRRNEIGPAHVRAVVAEQSALQQIPLDKFRDLLIEADALNARRIMRYREAFGELPRAASTVVTILMKSGLIDSAQPLPDDPLSEEIEEAHGVRRAYFHFLIPARDSVSAGRRYNGYVEFQLAAEQGLWLPTWANVEGDPIPLFDVEAFIPLRPYRIAYAGADAGNGMGTNGFVVTNDPLSPAPQPQTFSLLSVRGLGALRPFGGGAPTASRGR